jgi:hypothetical protein
MKPNNTNTAKPKGSSRLSNVKYVFRHPLVYSGAFVLIITITLLWLKIIPYTVAGPILGTAITLFATGLYSAMNYLSSTTTLSHVLDIECWSGDCRSGRISALVRNEGGVVVRDAKGVVSIAVVRGNNREQSLKGLLVKDACKDRSMPVNEANPHVIGEALAWGLPETTYWSTFKMDNQVVNANYAHITSISPGQRSRLLIFDYGYDWWSDTYVIKVYSEYGGLGPDDPVKRPYRACLLLDDSTKYEFEITVHGEGLRKPLGFKMSVVKDKLNALVRSDEIARLGGEDVVMDVLSEFENDGDESFIDRYWRIRTKILGVKSLDEYRSVAKELESLWNDIRNKLGSRAPYFGIVTGILNSYLVYLATINEQKRASELFKENKEALEREIESNVLTKLMLRLFKIEEIKIETKELIEILEKRRIYVPIPSDYDYIHIDKYYASAVKFLFGVYKSKDEALNECNGNNLCKRIVEAASGDIEALNELKSDKIRQSSENKELKELGQLLSNLKAKSFILTYLPSTPYARFALMIYGLIEGDAESVRALAYVGWKMPSRYAPLMMQVERYKQLLDQIGDLFREVYDACSSNCNIDNEQLRLAILKLYHRLV